MARSVSYPRGAYVTFAETPVDEAYCCACYNAPEDCECSDDEQVIAERSVDWDWIISDHKAVAMRLFASLWEADEWIGREDHVLASNRLVHFGISEYCGLMAIWLVVRDDLEDEGKEALADKWIRSVWPKFEKTFGRYRYAGTFYNGEAVYYRIRDE